MIIASFMRVVYPLKYPSNACLSCLDNGPLLLECNYIRVSKCHRCLTSKQASYQNKSLKYQSIANMPFSNICNQINVATKKHSLTYLQDLITTLAGIK